MLKFAFLGILAACAYILVPPAAFPDRQKVDPTKTTLDNEYYDFLGNLWHDPTSAIGGLYSVNEARIPYFDEALVRELGTTDRTAVSLLDVGCGGGIATLALAELGYNITGIDVSKNSLETARAEGLRRQVKARFVQGSAYRIPFDDNSFDAIVCSDVLEHLHDLTTALAEVNRVLKPGGVYVFDTINRTWFSYILFILGLEYTLGAISLNTHDHRMFITPDEMTVALTGAGLSPVQGLTGADADIAHASWSDLFTFLRTGRLRNVISFTQVNSVAAMYLGFSKKP